jgi:hypothetical protein
VLAGLTLVEARLRLKDLGGAIEIAAPLAARADAGPVNRVYALGFLADAHDRQGEYDKAFAFYSQANDLQAELFPDLERADASPFHPTNVDAMTRHVTAQGLTPLPCGAGEPMPVFLVGFPRSGTTLLEQVLASHPRVKSFGEHTALMETCSDLYCAEGALDRFAALDEDAAAARRERYWQSIAERGTLDPGQILLDKLPLNTIFLPHIAKIFPHAQILFAVRDPRDVVLSCFQQRFGMNVAMYQLLGLESAARYYDSVMELAMAARAVHEFPLREVRYEDVVADLEGEARAVIHFLGLEWDEAVLAYREDARDRAINTPSVAQVVEPIYSSSRGKWRNYETRLAPVMPTLAPWVKRFAYA